ncbi:uncharacterized protein LOC129194347 [Dunckerocampus dactyliophorus]|uniref:uncharacterized protein LOC129194347 n=1 Tax=Dunckerocampus dactyliophorus TaxID=161453 RepID=UPI00240680DA|nr:uncharacterized protein LOC129194347 [Dunckerocampus dactyliophorus]
MAGLNNTGEASTKSTEVATVKNMRWHMIDLTSPPPVAQVSPVQNPMQGFNVDFIMPQNQAQGFAEGDRSTIDGGVWGQTSGFVENTLTPPVQNPLHFIVGFTSPNSSHGIAPLTPSTLDVTEGENDTEFEENTAESDVGQETGQEETSDAGVYNQERFHYFPDSESEYVDMQALNQRDIVSDSDGIETVDFNTSVLIVEQVFRRYMYDIACLNRRMIENIYNQLRQNVRRRHSVNSYSANARRATREQRTLPQRVHRRLQFED